jgi:hypothetical protein
MEYRFSMTPRLLVLAVLGLMTLFILLFLMGMQVGQRLDKSPQPPKAESVGASAVKPASTSIPSANSLSLPISKTAAAPVPVAAPAQVPAKP